MDTTIIKHKRSRADELRETLQNLVHNKNCVMADKKNALADYNSQLKDIDDEIEEVMGELSMYPTTGDSTGGDI